MSFVGVFREGEIDGEPYHIFTLLSQANNPSSSSSSGGELSIDFSGDKDLEVQPVFACPTLRFSVEILKREENGYSEDQIIPFSTSSCFPNKPSFDQHFQSVFDSYEQVCKLPLDNRSAFVKDFNTCMACLNTSSNSFYICVRCWNDFHKECVESPLSIKHPSYPFLSLQLYSCPKAFKMLNCVSCKKTVQQMFYHCPTYNLILHPVCAMKPIPVFIDHPKRHPHPLTFFPKQNSLVCDICGLIKNLIPTYVCARCVFVAHQDCIYFPYVIRISRHRHRISFAYSLPAGIWSCGVCRKKVDNNCGAYSCNKCHDYFVHSRCALRKDLCDREELEGVPEEPDEIVVEPFVTIDDGIIHHFSHDNHLQLKVNRDYDDNFFCQACVLPIYGGNYYSCMDQYCNFILHEKCASSPLKIYHPLHHRPLKLKVVTDRYLNKEGGFHCSACQRQSCGFVYEDSPERGGMKLDLRCASVSEPFIYEGHAHPLYLALNPEEEESAICQICQDTCPIMCRKLNCIECEFIICFRCATLPYKARYKHDKHFLTFGIAEEASDESGWCEVCERKIEYSGRGGFYRCDDYCCTTLHVHCLLGTDPYMKPGQKIQIENSLIYVLRNNTMSRPRCHGHECKEDRCLYRVIFETRRGYHMAIVSFCSYNCVFTTLQNV